MYFPDNKDILLLYSNFCIFVEILTKNSHEKTGNTITRTLPQGADNLIHHG